MGVWTRRSRFAHSIIEPLLDDVHVESVQVTTTEAFDLADRGSFYDRMFRVLGGPYGRHVIAADAKSGTCDVRRRRGRAAPQALQRR
jgi:hypothetical protein